MTNKQAASLLGRISKGIGGMGKGQGVVATMGNVASKGIAGVEGLSRGLGRLPIAGNATSMLRTLPAGAGEHLPSWMYRLPSKNFSQIENTVNSTGVADRIPDALTDQIMRTNNNNPGWNNFVPDSYLPGMGKGAAARGWDATQALLRDAESMRNPIHMPSGGDTEFRNSPAYKWLQQIYSRGSHYHKSEGGGQLWNMQNLPPFPKGAAAQDSLDYSSPGGAFTAGALGGPIWAGVHGSDHRNALRQALYSLIGGGAGALGGGLVGGGLIGGSAGAAIGKMTHNPNLLPAGAMGGAALGALLGGPVGSGLGSMIAARRHNKHLHRHVEKSAAVRWQRAFDFAMRQHIGMRMRKQAGELGALEEVAPLAERAIGGVSRFLGRGTKAVTEGGGGLSSALKGGLEGIANQYAGAGRAIKNIGRDFSEGYHGGAPGSLPAEAKPMGAEFAHGNPGGPASELSAEQQATSATNNSREAFMAANGGTLPGMENAPPMTEQPAGGTLPGGAPIGGASAGTPPSPSPTPGTVPQPGALGGAASNLSGMYGRSRNWLGGAVDPTSWAGRALYGPAGRALHYSGAGTPELLGQTAMGRLGIAGAGLGAWGANAYGNAAVNEARRNRIRQMNRWQLGLGGLLGGPEGVIQQLHL